MNSTFNLRRTLVPLCILLASVTSACISPKEIMFKDEKVAKAGNKVTVVTQGAIADTLRIEILKQGKFDLVDSGADYYFNVNAILDGAAYVPTNGKNEPANIISGRYSLSATKKSGEIVFIHVIADIPGQVPNMKSTLARTLAVLAEQLL